MLHNYCSGFLDKVVFVNSNVKRLIIVCAVALVLFLLISQPGQAAELVHDIIAWLREAATSIATFFKAVVHG